MTPELSIHPYLRAGWKQETPAIQPAVQPALPDVNPADVVVQRMRAKLIGAAGTGTVIRGQGTGSGTAGVASGGSGGASGGSTLTVGHGGGGGGGWGASTSGTTTADVNDLQAAAATNAAAIAAVDAKITGASIAAVCNGDGTITVTLTWG